MEEQEASGIGLRRHPDREVRRRMAPVPFPLELLDGVLGVVDDQVRPVAQFQDTVGNGGQVTRGLVVRQVHHRRPVGLDAEAECVARMRDACGP